MVKKSVDKDIIAVISFFVFALLVYLYRINWGMASVDETFYLTTPFRLVQGDALLVDEWHVSQLSAVLIYPILKIYLYFFRNTEGIVLAFRYVFLIFHFTLSVVSYVLLRKKNDTVALWMGVLFFMFNPFNIMALSYNTMGLDFVFLYAILVSTEDENGRIKSYFKGILLAFSVLCNPYLAVIYFFNIIYTAYDVIRNNNRKTLSKCFYFNAGIGTILVIFLVFVFSRATVKEVIDSIVPILSDPGYQPKSFQTFLEPLVSFGRTHSIYVLSLFIVYIIGIMVNKIRLGCFILAVFISMMKCVCFALNVTVKVGFAEIMLPMTLLGFIAFSYSNGKNWLIFKAWLIGIVYAVCMNWSSDTGIYAIATACAVSSMFSVWLIYLYLKKNVWQSVFLCIFSFIVIAQLFSEAYVKLNHVYREKDLQQMSVQIDRGPAKGVITSEERKNIYDSNYENLQMIKENYKTEGKNLLLFKKFPGGYLIMDHMRMGAYSSWLNEANKKIDEERIVQYYSYHHEKIPDFIYVDSESSHSWSDDQWHEYAKNIDYDYVKFDDGAWLFVK